MQYGKLEIKVRIYYYYNIRDCLKKAWLYATL